MARLVAQARLPLYRNAYAWMASTAGSSGLGIIYWLAATHYYSTETVGLSAAVISAMIFLSGVAQLNLASALIRFIPNAGQETGRLLGQAYAASLFMAALLSFFTVAGWRTWFVEVTFAGPEPYLALWFIVTTMLWCIFNLQDSALAGLRDATWVPVANISYAVAKIALLLLLANALPNYGILASWLIPVIGIILPINFLIFRRLIPRHVRAMVAQTPPIVPAQVAKYVAGNYAGSLFLLASTRLLPVLVIQQAGADAAAYFFLPWVMANSLKAIAANMTASLTVEGAYNQTNLITQGSHFLRYLAGVLVPVTVILLVGAPYLLRLSGSSYSAEGTALLRLLALSVIPGTITLVYTGMARVQQRIVTIVLIQASFCVLALASSAVLLSAYGITGVGFAFLASETIVALALLLTRSGQDEEKDEG